ncbi:MAG TPA: outer membrane beta-barrel protein [Candidatus Aquilonibacter sp.]|nr:outer membrane beta-barrel protein [Candidatus Aquilonibacter sp.]
MRRVVAFIVPSFLSVLLLGAVASAQAPAGNVFFGYSYYNTDMSSIDRANTNGWEASLEGKMLPWIGIVADFDGHYGSQNFPVLCPGGACTFNASFSEHNVLFGPRVGVQLGRIRPFGEVLIGVAHVHVNGVNSDTSFGTAIGGGLDYRLMHLLAWRFQGDYVQTRFFSSTQNNVRFSTGIVLRF